MCFGSVLYLCNDPVLLSEPGDAHEVHGSASVSLRMEQYTLVLQSSWVSPPHVCFLYHEPAEHPVSSIIQ